MAQIEDNATETGDETVSRLTALNSQLLAKTRELETALQSRIVIEQAKGMLCVRHDVDLATAFDALRRAARSNRLRIHDLASRVVAEPVTPREIQRYLP
jgi:AmiR/NasT family two-component response regulator